MKIEEKDKEFFGPLYEFIVDDSITDIDYNGHTLWLTKCDRGKYLSDLKIDEDFVEQFSKRVANTVSRPFHKMEPILEAETKTLRITFVHESIAQEGRCFCIRKSLPKVRLSEEEMLDSGYATPEMISFLKRAVASGMNIVFAGAPGAGKTELAKFSSRYIPKTSRVITIEDNPEWHYHSLRPDADSVELKVNEQFSYTKAIKTSLRLNPNWLMLSEARSSEVVELLECLSTGVSGFTTLHTDSVTKIPDRILNMAKASRNESRMENDVYSFIDLGILIRKEFVDGQLIRRIEQVGYFERENETNEMYVLFDNGKWQDIEWPKSLEKRLEMAKIEGEKEEQNEDLKTKPEEEQKDEVQEQKSDLEKPGLNRAQERLQETIKPLPSCWVNQKGKGGTYRGSKEN